MIVGVRDVVIPILIDRHAERHVEFGACGGAAISGKSVRAIAHDGAQCARRHPAQAAIARVHNKDLVASRIYDDAGWKIEAVRGSRRGRTWRVLAIIADRRVPGQCAQVPIADHADAVVAGIGDIDDVERINKHTRRTGEIDRSRRAAEPTFTVEAGGAGPGEGIDQSALGVDDANAVVARIGDVEPDA